MKSYRQYCALAKALDHVGDRWTLLIVRELLIGPRRYSEIRAALPGIATNLLAQRLRGLEADGIVRRVNVEGPYELTELGRGLERTIHDLVRWGGHWMGERDPDEAFHPNWLAVALAAMLPRRRSGKLEIRTEGIVIGVDRGRVRVGSIDGADAIVEGPAGLILGIAAGRVPLSAVRVKGNHQTAGRLLLSDRSSERFIS